MAFRDDWLREHDRLRRRVNPAKLDERMRHEYDVFESVAKGYVTETSVKLVRNEHDVALQKARQRRGQEPLPGWYEITYRKHIQTEETL